MSLEEGDVIFEIRRVGDIQRVAAVHVPTGVEIVVQAPVAAALADVRALALRKLARALESEAPPTAPPERGKLV